MKFSISADKFFNAVNKLNYVVPGSSHSTLPILTNIYFNLEGNNLSMVSTDLEAFIKTGIEVEGTENGTVAVPARKLLDLLKALIIKSESVISKSPFNQDLYGVLLGESVLPELADMNTRYDNGAGMLIYKGTMPNDSFAPLDQALADMKEKTGSREDLQEAFNAFSEAMKNYGAKQTSCSRNRRTRLKLNSNLTTSIKSR